MKNSFDLIVEVIRQYFKSSQVIGDDEITEELGVLCDRCRIRLDFVGAAFWDKLLQIFVLRNGEGRDIERREVLSYFMLMFGDRFTVMHDNMRAFIFWKDVMPMIIELRSRSQESISKYEPGGEYYKDPVCYKFMLELSEKNVKILKSIIDNRIGFTKEVKADFMYRNLVDILDSDVPAYKKAILGFVYLYYLVNRYGIILKMEDLEMLNKDADEWALENRLGEDSLSFIKGLSDRLENAGKEGKG